MSTIMKKRLIMAFIGVCCTGVSIALFRKAGLGADPFTCLNVGITNAINMTYGTVYPVITGVMFVLVLIFDRHYIGIATVLNLFGIGFVVDFCMLILDRLFETPDILVKILLFIAGIVVVCFGSSLYFTADLGVSAYDAMSLILSDKKVAAFRVCRIGTDILCVLVGFICGAGDSVGVGTVITALCMGPIIQY